MTVAPPQAVPMTANLPAFRLRVDALQKSSISPAFNPSQSDRGAAYAVRATRLETPTIAGPLKNAGRTSRARLAPGTE